ncbi:hypothetical protein BaRGS_00038393 [Batillaria attramentaria]|uniref:Myogenesis-regulating glycosidase n=1 Tax=Batillaria attramentaria TaxID=370345 RepID=A0ABD0J5X1_9CAEN
MSNISGRWLALIMFCVVVVVAVIVGVMVWKLAPDDDDGNADGSADAQRAWLTLPFSASLGDLLSLRISDSSTLTVKSASGETTNIAEIGTGTSPNSKVARCDVSSESDLCFEWEGEKDLRITRHQDATSDVECFNVTWTARSCVSQVLKDCYDLEHAHWYGGFQDYNQYWPLNRVQQKMAPYLAGDTWQQMYGDVMERLFVSSNGFGIYVDPDVPLYLSFNQSNDGKICLEAKYDKYPYFNNNNSLPFLRYAICQGADVRAVHGHMIGKHVPKPSDIPAEDLFSGPIWSTWAMYKGAVNQTKVLEFAQQIRDSKFPYSQLEIDDDWTPKYGDMDFNKEKFPDAKGMISDLTKLGFRLTVWLHPFFNLDSAAGQYAARKGYLLKALDSKIPALVSWWRGDVAFMLDVTNQEAVQWYLNNTQRLRDVYNVTSFKYDAGEYNWLPNAYTPSAPIFSPDEFSKLYVDMAYRSDLDVRAQEVRVGVRSQDKPIMFRMLDRQTNWGYHRAIRTVIPCALTFGIIGYPFVLPDMIGGNGYDETCIDCTKYPEPELYIRWLQANTFLPLVQFSVGPFVYNDTVVAICRKFMDLRSNYTDRIVSLARDATRTGFPIVRPLWWIAPTDSDALTTDSQYLLGDDLLVAPVLEEGLRSRDVYLPAGTWRDELRGGNYTGPQWLKGYAADIDELPYFQRL